MKKIVAILLVVLIYSTNAFAQREMSSRQRGSIKWLSIALKAGYGNSLLINKNVLNDPKVSMEGFTPSISLGGRLGLTVGDFVSFYPEAYLSKFGQKYNISFAGPYDLTYNKDLQITTLQTAFVIRYTGYVGAFAEIGGSYSLLQTVVDSNLVRNQSSLRVPNFYSDEYLKENYMQQFPGVIFGVGITPVRTDRFDMMIGLRANYHFIDLMLNNTNPLDDGYYNHDEFYYDNYQSLYAPTNAFTFQVMFEFSYIFGFWGNASCGKRNLVFFQ